MLGKQQRRTKTSPRTTPSSSSESATTDRATKTPPSQITSSSEVIPTDRKHMKDFAKQIQKRGLAELVDEFNAIPNAVTPSEHKNFTDNPDRNRYKNIVCLDSTRVHLNWPPGTKDDYIHANWISGFPELNNKLIATQAPLQNTIGDFWRMIWQEKAAVIVMLCQLIEDNKRKSDLYWPHEPKDMFQRDGLSIENRGVEEQQDKQMRISKLVVKGRSTRTGEIREHAVTHVMWRGWPDKDVPTSAANALQLLVKVGRSSNDVVVVHCSAGIGRTGTIIALDIALRRLLAGRKLDVKEIVTKLREQRYKACQTHLQYLYIHYALTAYLELKGYITDEEYADFKQAYILASSKKN